LNSPSGGTTVGGDVTVVGGFPWFSTSQNLDSKIYPKGNATIPRESVTVLSLIETRSRWGRKMGSRLGTLAGVLAGGYIAAKSRVFRRVWLQRIPA
jgi:hypothetical protein